MGETKIQAKTPPVMTGQHTLRTGEISTFRKLRQGEDDSAIEPVESETEQRTSKAAKNDMARGRTRGRPRSPHSMRRVRGGPRPK